MIAGIGVDIATISRVRHSWERFGERFARRILNDDELRELLALADDAPGITPERFLAKRFAVKEAAAKAVGTGEREGVLFRDFSLAHDALGKPLLRIHGQAAERCRQLGINAYHVSLSDEGDQVIAFVVLESATGTPAATAT